VLIGDPPGGPSATVTGSPMSRVGDSWVLGTNVEQRDESLSAPGESGRPIVAQMRG